jgi:hypothetical protein
MNGWLQWKLQGLGVVCAGLLVLTGCAVLRDEFRVCFEDDTQPTPDITILIGDAKLVDESSSKTNWVFEILFNFWNRTSDDILLVVDDAIVDTINANDPTDLKPGTFLKWACLPDAGGRKYVRLNGDRMPHQTADNTFITRRRANIPPAPKELIITLSFRVGRYRHGRHDAEWVNLRRNITVPKAELQRAREIFPPE